MTTILTVVVLIFATPLMNAYNAFEKHSLETIIIQRRDLVNKTLFNFTDPENKTVFADWVEHSDNVENGGRSKATLVPLNGQNYQSAIFFYLLNHQANGPTFAGVHKIHYIRVLPLYDGVEIDLHRRGLNSTFKLIFDADCSNTLHCDSFESNFTTTEGRQQIQLPFNKLKQNFRETQRSNSKHSVLKQVYRFGIQAYTHINGSTKEYGAGSIEIYYIKVYKLKP
ncbi:unnamed protein product [Schistosoma curassoni]|uniref:CIA30 domain-containing protein n=1 Tax=Schistosoma curassoni TaxID=6186 RepID=A0A183JRD9_9TREM|nr:unnamed protein product [Schistosoma curassoni]VDO94456.1 unnamed protein product [Schistosoma curassoni]